MRRMSLALLAVFGVVLALAHAQSSPKKTARPQTTRARASSLADFADGVASGKYQVIDLAQPLNERTPIIQLPPPFANTTMFSKRNISNFDDKGPAWYWNDFTTGEHVGTHFDAPCHWITGKDKPCVDGLQPSQFIGPAAVIDVTAAVASTADFVAGRQTILDWEAKHGRIPRHAWVILRTGWGKRANDAAAFMNVGPDKAPHYPGFGRESAEFLTTERDILGVGTEAVGTDAAIGSKAQPPFPNHSIMHGAGKFGLTQLANVVRLPETGAVVIATPLKIERGSGSPVRVIAVAPAAAPSSQ